MKLYSPLCVALLLGIVQGEVLSNFIRHYEPLIYDSESLLWNHHRVRRSMVGERSLQLQFTAFGRHFNLLLKPETRFFHNNFTLTIDGQKSSSQLAKIHLYSGIDQNNSSVRVYGNLAHEVFDGTIIADEEMYHIEPSRRYLRDASHHSVIYRHSDLDLSTVAGATCGSSNEAIRRELLQLQDLVIRSAESARLQKRQTRFDSTLVRCWLYAIADYKFVAALEAAGDNPLGVMSTIILTGSRIFERTDFDSDGLADGIHFGLLGMEVENTPPASGSFYDNQDIGVQAFLNEHSTADWSQYCLSYRFTSRDFDDGVVGLAYVAPQPGVNAVGGICENIQTFSGDGVTQSLTLNTGIVTILNYNARIPSPISALTFAHQAGHNFGSTHDPRADPPDAGGLYIMDAFSSDGSQPNNNLFSPRSRAEMLAVIRDRGQSSRSGCFVPADSLCGNNLLDEEEGEQCDCGPLVNSDGICTDNPCCNGTSCLLNMNVECSPQQGPCCNASTCMFVEAAANMTCSMETDCAASQTCSGTNASCPAPDPLTNEPGLSYRLCMNGEAICDNGGREMVAPEQRGWGVGQRAFCVNGGNWSRKEDFASLCTTIATEAILEFCTGTYCVVLGLPDCECSAVEQACHVCCRFPDGNCTSTLNMAAEDIQGRAADLPGGMGANKQMGFPCVNFTGYCDFFNTCMTVNEDGACNQTSNLSTSAVIGIVVGSLALLLALSVAVILLVALSRRSEDTSEMKLELTPFDAYGPVTVPTHVDS
ncbi:disintegrin and metalloproteinase domain-containing protein 10-like isoform X3 [Halichondria panicea]|uniref:disintegrin and metalloproteinase domain-containing protein 10-like isoform X3 n=1 Tax=Halichondria panicea TaxID=6063 RepID=UPI00312BB208